MYKSCCLVYWVLTVSVVLAQNQPSPCDLPQKCFPPMSAVNVPGTLQNLFTQARCYSACVEDERLNLSTAAVKLNSTLPHWPSVHLKESAGAIVQGSPADELTPFSQFSCKFVNASFAVVNRYGASRMSPPVAMCGGGIVYPSHVRELEVTLVDDHDRREEFNADVVMIILSWKPPPEAQFVTEYQIQVIPTSIEDHCPKIQDVIEPFSIPKDSVSFTLESSNSTGFKLPVSCEFRIVIESLPQISETLSADLKQSEEIFVTTEYIGELGLNLTVMSDWTWNETGFYSLRLNVSLPDVGYVREGLRELEITVHTARISNIQGGYKILQILPSDRIAINANQLTYVHTLSARYPPKEDDVVYVFDIRPKHHAAYYNYRMPEAKKLSFSAPIDWGDPGSITNGRRSITGTTYTSTVTYKCNAGYRLKGSRSRTCMANGQWSGSVPTCKAIPCVRPPASPANGRRSGSGTTYQSTRTYTCNPGYFSIPPGPIIITCMANRRWNGSAPRCVGLQPARNLQTFNEGKRSVSYTFTASPTSGVTYKATFTPQIAGIPTPQTETFNSAALRTTSGLTPDVTYRLQVFAVLNGMESTAISRDFTTKPDVPSGPPQGLAVADHTTTSINLTWSDPAPDRINDRDGATGFEVRRNGQRVTTVTDRTFTFTGLSAATSYEFEVLAINEQGIAPDNHAAELTTSTASGVPNPPTLQVVLPRFSLTYLVWRDPEPYAGDIIGVQIRYLIDCLPLNIPQLGSGVHQFSIFGIKGSEGKTHSISLRARTTAGWGNYSTPVDFVFRPIVEVTLNAVGCNTLMFSYTVNPLPGGGNEASLASFEVNYQPILGEGKTETRSVALNGSAIEGVMCLSGLTPDTPYRVTYSVEVDVSFSTVMPSDSSEPVQLFTCRSCKQQQQCMEASRTRIAPPNEMEPTTAMCTKESLATNCISSCVSKCVHLI